ncbi:MAG: hypothetical protein AAB785_01595 [Patescibacteria group bacterium]
MPRPETGPVGGEDLEKSTLTPKEEVSSLELEARKIWSSDFFQRKWIEAVRRERYAPTPADMREKLDRKEYDELRFDLLHYLDIGEIVNKCKSVLGDKRAPINQYQLGKEIRKNPNYLEDNGVTISDEEKDLIQISQRIEDTETLEGGSHRLSDKFRKIFPETKDFNYIADLAVAVVDSREELQPSGAKLIELSHKKGTPAVIVSGHHAKGQWGAVAVNELLENRGFITRTSGYYKEQGYMGRPPNTDLFVIPKTPHPDLYPELYDLLGSDDIEATVRKIDEDEDLKWQLNSLKVASDGLQLVLDRIKSKSKKERNVRILLVDDNPRVINTFRAVFHHEISRREVNFVFARDLQSAMRLLEQRKFDGVISDLYYPSKTSSGDKTTGEEVLMEVMLQYLPAKKARVLLNRAKAMQRQYEDVLKEGYEQLSKWFNM